MFEATLSIAPTHCKCGRVNDRFIIEPSEDMVFCTHPCPSCGIATPPVVIKGSLPFRCPACLGRVILAGKSFSSPERSLIGTKCLHCQASVQWCRIGKHQHNICKENLH